MSNASKESVDATVPANPPPDAANPCPFLRAMRAQAHITEQEPLGRLGKKISAAMDSGVDDKPHPLLIVGIGLLGSAKSVANLLRTVFSGLRVDQLRTGPLDKFGGGSRILDQSGVFAEEELTRMKQFTSMYCDEAGEPEAGLSAAQIEEFMDANFTRPTKRRRRIDRSLMNGEWSALFQALAKNHGPEPYMSFAEVRTMIFDRALPERVTARIPASDQG